MSPEERQAMIAGMVGQLEERLGSEGGPLEEWSKLITSLGVLGEADRAKAAYARATAAFSGDDAALATLLEAATTAGIAP
jgi:cytochrome c-type biogenesis protein CcmH